MPGGIQPMSMRPPGCALRVGMTPNAFRTSVIGWCGKHPDEGNVAALIARSAMLGELLAGLYELGFRQAAPQLRPGLHSRDAARFVLSTALGLLLGLSPGVQDADQVRRYVGVFVLPALLIDPPPAGPVFTV